MRMPEESSSSEVLLETFGEYHLAALKAVPLATGLVAESGGKQGNLRTALTARQGAADLGCRLFRPVELGGRDPRPRNLLRDDRGASHLPPPPVPGMGGEGACPTDRLLRIDQRGPSRPV